MSARADVIIHEIMFHPGHAPQTAEPAGAEFIELRNTDPVNAVSITGWSIDSGVTYTFPSTLIPADGYIILASNPSTFANTYSGVPVQVVGPWQGRLSNSGERVRLVNATGLTVDEVTYSDQGDWAVRRRGPLDNDHQGWIWFSAADGEGSSLELVNPAQPNDEGQNWRTSTHPGGTPGAANSTASSNAAPLILRVKHSPAIPTSSDFVHVTAQLTDETTTGLSASVHYRPASMRPGAFSVVPMVDNALKNDGDANDGIFGARLPAFANGTVIEFYIEASDGTHTRTWPDATDNAGTQGANALYQVENTLPAASSDLPVYRLVMSKSEDDEFAYGDFNLYSNAQMNTTFIAKLGTDTDVRYLAGLRRRGAGSRKKFPRSLRLNLARDQPWDNTTSLNLNAIYPYLQTLGQNIFAASGLPSAVARQVKIFINSSDESESDSLMYGSYVHMEPLNSDAVAHQFPDDPSGNLYKKRKSKSSLTFRNGDVSKYLDDNWAKGSNESQWDWSDLDGLLGAINDTSNPDYLDNLEAMADIDQWLRWFAAMALLNNGETNLSTGADDDYSIYSGVTDPRIKLVPHDFDTILGGGDNYANNNPEHTIYDMIEDDRTLPVLETLMRHPEIVPRYHTALRNLIEGPFSKENFDHLLQSSLGGWVPQSARNEIITFMDQRRAYVLSLISSPLIVQSSLNVISGYPWTVRSSTSLNGALDMTRITTLLVNGQQAAIDTTNGTWSIESVVLRPGINRVIVQALDANGTEVERQSIDIWQEDSSMHGISGALSENMTLTAAGGPYLVSGDLTVPAGITLTVQAGVTIFFTQGTRLTVNGRLDASGSEFARIRFSVRPGSGNTWDGVYFTDTLNDNRMAFLDQEFSDSANHSVEVENARLHLEDVQWRGISGTVIEISGPQVNIINCDFPSTGESEAIHGASLSGDDWFNLIGNVFRSTTDSNDIVDFSGGRRPGPIIYIIGNSFTGGTDDCLDLDGIDAHIEGNIFTDIHSDDPDRPSTSNCIATDDDAHITVVRNIFDNVDHALLLKNDADAIFENNIVRGATLGAISFNEPLRRVDAGSHIVARGNIFIDNTLTFSFPNHLDGTDNPPVITAENNIMPAAEHHYGSSNMDIDPAFVDAAAGDFRLLPGSPAIGSGINGTDMGAFTPPGASISGEPPASTRQSSATLSVYIPGISGIESGSFTSEYRWRLNGGSWSANTPIATPITLTNLTNGSYTVEVVGKNSAAWWQVDSAPTASKTWTVNDALPVQVRINEVLADSEFSSDWIELYNGDSTDFDLAGMSIADNPDGSRSYVFRAGELVPAGGYLVIHADDDTVPAGIHTGFGLKSGDGVFLFDTTANGGALVDSVSLGVQVPEFSIGRHAHDADWTLTVPTPGAANLRQGTGDPLRLSINEWLAAPSVVISDDFIELYNPGNIPVDISGLYLTDNPGGEKTKFQVPPLSYIGANGFVVFVADNKPSAGPHHTNFSLDANAEWIALYDPSLVEIDLVAFSGQVDDISQGRNPDGSSQITTMPLPTPGMTNALSGSENAIGLLASLRITELMYDPDNGSDFEFIELQNIGLKSLNLTGVRFVTGIDFVFPPMILSPGEFVLLVSDRVSFERKYGVGLPIVGQYTGKLSNGGEEIVLRLPKPYSGNVMRFTYNDKWFPGADGGGHSLEIIDPQSHARGWSDQAYWRQGALQGTPSSSLSVSAGNDQFTQTFSAFLNGSAMGMWTPATSWRQLSGPVAATINSPAALTTPVAFAEPGTYVFQITANDGGVSLVSNTTVFVNDNFAAWAARNSVTEGESGNDDKDRYSNLYEYAFDLDPHAADIDPFHGTVSAGNAFNLIYPRYPRKSDITYTAELSIDLSAWVEADQSFISSSGDLEQWTVDLSLGGTARQYTRITVSRED